MNNSRWWTILPGVFLSSCYYEESFYPEVIVREAAGSQYEVQLRKHIEGRGNVHTLSLSKFEYESADWLYVKTTSGTIEADSLVFTRYWACLEYPWSTQKLKGSVAFKDGLLVIALQGPWYEDGKTLSGYRPLDINGAYSVRIEKGRYKPTQTDIDGAPCDRSWIGT